MAKPKSNVPAITQAASLAARQFARLESAAKQVHADLAASIGAAYAGFRCPMVAEPGKPIVWYNANSRFECGKDRIRAASEACMDKPHKAFNRCTQNLLNRP